EGAARLRPTHCSHHGQGTVQLSSRATLRVLPALRHEAAIDHNTADEGSARHGKHPIAGPRHVVSQRRSTRIDEGFLPGNESRGKRHAPELIPCRVESGPLFARRQWYWRRRNTPLEREDQGLLPSLAFHLPGTKPNERRQRHERKHTRQHHTGAAL